MCVWVCKPTHTGFFGRDQGSSSLYWCISVPLYRSYCDILYLTESSVFVPSHSDVFIQMLFKTYLIYCMCPVHFLFVSLVLFPVFVVDWRRGSSFNTAIDLYIVLFSLLIVLSEFLGKDFRVSFQNCHVCFICTLCFILFFTFIFLTSIWDLYIASAKFWHYDTSRIKNTH